MEDIYAIKLYGFIFGHIVIQFLLATLAASEISNVQTNVVTQYFEKYTDTSIKVDELPRCRRCGQALTSDTGSIYYKPLEPILSNERCSWIIGVKGAVGYRVNIQYVGFNQSSTLIGLLLTGARHGPVLTNYMPSPDSFDICGAHILVVTFYSTLLSDTTSTGFALQYESIQFGGIEKTANQSAQHVFEHMTFDFKHPLTALYYATYEFSSFLAPPNGNIYSGENITLYYNRGDLDGYRDAVYAVNVSQSSEDMWESRGRICDDDIMVQITSDDIILILSQSDKSVINTGFYLTYETC